jgi:hypothetical protein
MSSLCYGLPGDDLDARIDLLTLYLKKQMRQWVHKQGCCNFSETKFGDTIPTCSPVTIHRLWVGINRVIAILMRPSLEILYSVAVR